MSKLKFNVIRGNTIVTNTSGSGGGVALGNTSPGSSSQAALEGNVIRGNLGTNGAGLWVSDEGPVVRSNIVAENRPLYGDGSGMGIYIEYASLTLANNTIARNLGANGDGVYVTNGASATFLNTIVASQTVGVKRNSGTVTMSRTLWQGNGANVSGSVTDSDPVSGTVAFAADGYHLTAGSAAIDAGNSTSGEVDVDGQPRTMGPKPDIGADEYPYETDLRLGKVREGSGSVNAGAPITFTLTVTNIGPYAPADARVADTVSPASAVAGLSATTPGGDCQTGGATVTCSLYNVPTDTVRLMTVVVTPTATYNGVLTNTATVTATDALDADGGNNAAGPVAVTVVYVPPTPDLSVTKTGPAYAQPNGAAVYTVTWRNSGNAAAASTVLTDTLPSGVSYVSAGGSPTRSGQILTWDLSSVGPGAGGSYTVAVSVIGGLADGTVLTNTASIATATAGDPSADNTAVVTTTVSELAGANLLVTCWNCPTEAELSETLGTYDYTIRISNTGAVQLNLTLENPIPRGTEYAAGTARATMNSVDFGTIAYDSANKRIVWTGSLPITREVSIDFSLKFVACGGAEVGVVENVASVKAAGYSYVWTDKRETKVLCPDLEIKSVEAPRQVQVKQTSSNTYVATIRYANNRVQSRLGDVSLATQANVAVFLPLVPGVEYQARFKSATPDRTGWNTAIDWNWEVGTLQPGEEGAIQLEIEVPGRIELPIYLMDKLIANLTLRAVIRDSGRNPPEEWSKANNTAEDVTYPLEMAFAKSSGPVRPVFLPGGMSGFEVEYFLRYQYRNADPNLPPLSKRKIDDTWPRQVEWRNESSDPSMGFKQVSESTLRWESAEQDRLQVGDGGRVRIRGQADISLPPGTALPNQARIDFWVQDNSLYYETAADQATIPLLPPRLIEPGDGMLCPGAVQVVGLAQVGTLVDVYVDGQRRLSDVRPEVGGRFTATLTLSTAGSFQIAARARATVEGQALTSSSSNVVSATVATNLGWCPQRSVWTGTIQAGPLQGKQVAFQFRDESGKFATQNWQIPGVFGFWNTELKVWGCGCDSIDATQTITVTADGKRYVQSKSSAAQTFTFNIGSAHQGVRIETSCTNPQNPAENKQTSSTGDVLIDPDGYVFDVTKGLRAVGTTTEGTPIYINTIEGVTVTAMVSMTEWGGWVPWPAHLYNNQVNPQVTGPDGYFAFFTPPGFYYLRVDGKAGYQSWRSPVVQVITEIVHVNVPLTPLPTGGVYTVTLMPEGLSPGVITVPVGSNVAWVSSLTTTATITDTVRYTENPVLRPLSALDPLSSTLGWDGGYLEPGKVYSRGLTQPGTYAYTDGLGRSGQVVVTGTAPTPTATPTPPSYRALLPHVQKQSALGGGW